MGQQTNKTDCILNTLHSIDLIRVLVSISHRNLQAACFLLWLKMVSYYQLSMFGTIYVLKLHNIKQTNVIWDDNFVSVPVNGHVNILYVFPSPIILSICTLLLEIFLSFITILPVILFFFLKKVGMLTWTFAVANKSWTLNPLSAMTLSPGSHALTMLQRSTICRSLVDPPYAWET